MTNRSRVVTIPQWLAHKNVAGWVKKEIVPGRDVSRSVGPRLVRRLRPLAGPIDQSLGEAPEQLRGKTMRDKVNAGLEPALDLCRHPRHIGPPRVDPLGRRTRGRSRTGQLYLHHGAVTHKIVELTTLRSYGGLGHRAHARTAPSDAAVSLPEPALRLAPHSAAAHRSRTRRPGSRCSACPRRSLRRPSLGTPGP